MFIATLIFLCDMQLVTYQVWRHIRDQKKDVYTIKVLIVYISKASYNIDVERYF